MKLNLLMSIYIKVVIFWSCHFYFMYILQETEWNRGICENKYFLTSVLLPVSIAVAQTAVVEYFRE
jgi:hypothetical protein